MRCAILVFLLSTSAFAEKAKTVFMTETEMVAVRTIPGRSTILSFPIKPTKVILGNQGMFAVEYVENDLAISALGTHARSNLFVYMEGRRFSFDLVATLSNGDEIVLVRDAIERPTRGKSGKGSSSR